MSTDKAAVMDDVFRRGLAAQTAVDQALDVAAKSDGPRQPSPYSGTPGARNDGFDGALILAAVAIANAARALRGETPVLDATGLHPSVLANAIAAALQAVLEMNPAARLEALADASEELRLFVERLQVDVDAIDMQADPVLFKNGCVAFVKVLMETYSSSLAAQLGILRSPATEGALRTSGECEVGEAPR